LLTRHITDKVSLFTPKSFSFYSGKNTSNFETNKADFAENKEYIALVVYKNNGKRIYYPSKLLNLQIKRTN